MLTPFGSSNHRFEGTDGTSCGYTGVSLNRLKIRSKSLPPQPHLLGSLHPLCLVLDIIYLPLFHIVDLQLQPPEFSASFLLHTIPSPFVCTLSCSTNLGAHGSHMDPPWVAGKAEPLTKDRDGNLVFELLTYTVENRMVDPGAGVDKVARRSIAAVDVEQLRRAAAEPSDSGEPELQSPVRCTACCPVQSHRLCWVAAFRG
jgi:hypothetical protein